MKVFSYYSVLAALAAITEAVPANAPRQLPLVQSNQLRRALLRSELIKKGQILQDFAFSTPSRNRVIGSPGHNSTVNYLVEQLTALNYYDVVVQPFSVPLVTSNLTVNNKTYEVSAMSYAPPGSPTASLAVVANLGCDAGDYPAAVSGSIALISRGSCQFSQKITLAKAAGAIGAVVYNNVAGPFGGTLGAPGNFIPTAALNQADGKALVAAITSGVKQVAKLVVVESEILTYNVIAQTKGGDKQNVLGIGAHTDSVEAGPGINDNGSGSIGILEVAIQLSKFSTNNAVRFGWWAAEEEGLLGAEHYVTTLPVAEQKKIRLYLNFDMIASPNFVYEIYDGDGSAFNMSGAPGSAQAEKLWEEYFRKEAKLPTQPTAFDGRSDYGPFMDAGIPAGGLSTGADGNKTAEEAITFGGTAGLIYDPNYHTANDTLQNLDAGAWIEMSKGIAHAVATYSLSFETLPPRNKTRVARRAARHFKRKGGKWLV